MRGGEAAAIHALQFLRINDVCQLLRISKPTLWRLRRTPGFPEPIEVTDRLIAWRRTEVEAWLATRHTASRGASTRPPRIVLNAASEEAPAYAPPEEIQKRPQSTRLVRGRVTPPLDDDEQLPLLLESPE
jgi:predicted DNA-binding transcriptional regulator AlpA